MHSKRRDCCSPLQVQYTFWIDLEKLSVLPQFSPLHLPGILWRQPLPSNGSLLGPAIGSVISAIRTVEFPGRPARRPSLHRGAAPHRNCVPPHHACNLGGVHCGRRSGLCATARPASAVPKPSVGG
ncbi:hypothetical protein SLA2020_447640 [Shorea laevis]